MTLVKSNHTETLKTLNNHQHYINLLQLSERIQCRIQRLKQYRIEQEIDALLLQTSPTETMITYYDNNNNNRVDAKCMYSNFHAHAILIILVHSVNNNATL